MLWYNTAAVHWANGLFLPSARTLGTIFLSFGYLVYIIYIRTGFKRLVDLEPPTILQFILP